MLKDMKNSFEKDLEVIEQEYMLYGQHVFDNQDALIEELKYAVGENREKVIEELRNISKNVIKWNSFIESYIERYSKEEKFKCQLEKFLIQPQR